MKGWLVIGAIVVAAVVWWRWPRTLVDVPLETAASTTGEDPCAFTERCVIVYMAPWCGACRQSVRIIDALHARWEDRDDIGIKVVLGRDGRDALEGMAASTRAAAYLDVDGTYWEKNGGRGFPHWIVTDAANRQRRTVSGTAMHVPSMLHHLRLDGY